MSRSEKLEALEEIWADLSRDAEAMESPSWHEQVLKETEERFRAGQETPVDWETAKSRLREASQKP
ncbi:acyl-protein synthetase [Verrucomicrobiaceae bacterium SCGC AG-212-N21]|nr:acyl-protein synthetase [Verrucomicrobiaceae bacterium SCGC AG-212-N21]